MRRWTAVASVIAVLVMAISAGADPGVTEDTGTDEANPAIAVSVDAQVTVNPLTVEVRLSRDSASAGQPVMLRAEILNLADVTIRDVSAEIRLDGSVRVIGGEMQTLGDIGPKRRAGAAWRVCGTEEGAVVGMVVVEGEVESHTFVTESTGFVLSMSEPPSERRCPGGG